MNKVKTGTNQYCVPAVISILTGKDTDECAREISYITGGYNITAVSYENTIKVLKRLKMEVTKIENACDCSLFTCMHYLAAREDSIYLVGVPSHVVAVEVIDHKVYLCDNHTKEPINGASSARLGQKVDKVYQVTKLPEPKILRVEVKAHNVRRLYYIDRFWSDGTIEHTHNEIECKE